MKIATLGASDELLELVEAASKLGHSLISAAQPDAMMSQLHAAAPGVVELDDWCDLLDSDAHDAIFIAPAKIGEVAMAELRAEQVLRLAAAGQTLLLVHPIVDELLVYYELDINAQESGSVIEFYFPGITSFENIGRFECEPFVQKDDAEEVRERAYELGEIQRISMERIVPAPIAQTVSRQFARDAYTLLQWVPRLNKLSALGTDNSDASYQHLAIQLSGVDCPQVRWQVTREHSFPNAALGKLSVTYKNGEQTFYQSASGEWSESTSARTPVESAINQQELASRQSAEQSGPSQSSPQGLVNRESAALLVTEKLAKTVAEGNAANSNRWERMIKAMDFADIIEVSLRRGRAIEIHSRKVTENTIFRGRMASVGCFMLMLLPVVLAVAGLVGDHFKWHTNPIDHWPKYMLALLIGFLGLQLVPWLLKRDREKEQ